MVEKCDGHGVLMKVPDDIVKKWLEFGISRLIDRMDVDPILASVAVALL